MLEARSFKTDFVALLLAGLTLFLALSILSYDRADAASGLAYPARSDVANLCGRAGAIAAAGLFRGIGLGAYFLVVSLVILDGALLRHRPISEPWLRAAGWLLGLVGFTGFATMALGRLTVGTVIGAGGYLGAVVRGVLEAHCASTGSYILVLSLMAGGLLLATDYLFVRIVALVARVPGRGFGRALSLVPLASMVTRRTAASAASQARNQQASEEDDEDEGNYEVRIRSKSADNAASADAQELRPAQPVVAVETRSANAPASVAGPSDAQPEGEAVPAASEDALRVKPPRKTDRDAVRAELDAASRAAEGIDYELPPLELLLDGEPCSFDEQEKDVRRKAKVLEKTFANFGFNVKVVEIETGPVIAQFEVELEAGLRLSKITSLSEDLAIALRVPSVRIVAPIPGKNTVGIEVPNNERQLVRLREVIEETNGKAAKMRIPVYLGKDVSGKPMVVDLTSLPHLLIAGRTGTGKSVCLNTIIMSMLMTRRPDDVRMLLIDPKMVELSPYMKLPHLMHPVVTDMKKAEAILGWAVEKMEERYSLLARAGVRHISVYNQLGEEELFERLQPESDEERQHIPTHLPYIVIVADEMADLMMTAAKEVEGHIIRLAQKSRAVGIHLVLATQKPTVDVITGLIKSNLPARISFQVASRTDSRVVLDEMGADKLLGNGDLLFLWPGTSTLLRGQGAFVSDDEIARVVDFVGTTEPQFVHELVALQPAAADPQAKTNRHQDDLYEAAVDIVIREGRGSVSLLQRSLGIGYGRAARLIDFMAEDGIVGQYNGSQAREVVITLEQWQAMSGQAPEEPTPPLPRTRIRTLTVAEDVDLDEANEDEPDEADSDDAEDASGEDEEQEEEDESDDEDADEEDDRLDDWEQESPAAALFADEKPPWEDADERPKPAKRHQGRRRA